MFSNYIEPYKSLPPQLHQTKPGTPGKTNFSVVIPPLQTSKLKESADIPSNLPKQPPKLKTLPKLKEDFNAKTVPAQLRELDETLDPTPPTSPEHKPAAKQSAKSSSGSASSLENQQREPLDSSTDDAEDNFQNKPKQEVEADAFTFLCRS